MKKNSTKWKIVDCLRNMAKTTPIDDISVSDLAAILGTSRQAFYYHFENLLEVMTWAVDARYNELSRDSKTLSVLEFVYDVARAIEAERDLVIAFYNSQYRDDIMKYLIHRLDAHCSVFIEHVLGGTVTKFEIKAASRFLAYAYAGTLADWVYAGMQVPSDRTRESIRILAHSALKPSIVSVIEKDWTD